MTGHEGQGAESPYFRSIAVFIFLAVATGIEYIIGTADDLPLFSSNVIPLVIIAVLKAGAIINYYMHISRIWSAEEDED